MTSTMTHLGGLVAELAARRPEPRALVPAAPAPSPPREVAAVIGALGQRLGGRCPALLHDRADDGAPTHRLWTEAAVGWLAEGATLDDLRDTVRWAEGSDGALPQRVELADVRARVFAMTAQRTARARDAGTLRRLSERTRADPERVGAARDAAKVSMWATNAKLLPAGVSGAVVDILAHGLTDEMKAALKGAVGVECAQRLWMMMNLARRTRKAVSALHAEVAAAREELRVVREARDPMATAEAQARIDAALTRSEVQGTRIENAADAEAARLARGGA